MRFSCKYNLFNLYLSFHFPNHTLKKFDNRFKKKIKIIKISLPVVLLVEVDTEWVTCVKNEFVSFTFSVEEIGRWADVTLEIKRLVDVDNIGFVVVVGKWFDATVNIDTVVVCNLVDKFSFVINSFCCVVDEVRTGMVGFIGNEVDIVVRFVGFTVINSVMYGPLAGVAKVVSSWTDWNVCNLTFSSVDVGILDEITFWFVVIMILSRLCCSLLASVLLSVFKTFVIGIYLVVVLVGRFVVVLCRFLDVELLWWRVVAVVIIIGSVVVSTLFVVVLCVGITAVVDCSGIPNE